MHTQAHTDAHTGKKTHTHTHTHPPDVIDQTYPIDMITYVCHRHMLGISLEVFQTKLSGDEKQSQRAQD